MDDAPARSTVSSDGAHPSSPGQTSVGRSPGSVVAVSESEAPVHADNSSNRGSEPDIETSGSRRDYRTGGPHTYGPLNIRGATAATTSDSTGSVRTGGSRTEPQALFAWSSLDACRSNRPDNPSVTSRNRRSAVSGISSRTPKMVPMSH